MLAKPGKAPKKSLYGSRWRVYRLAHLRENPLCVMCLELGRPVAANVVDHIRRHNGTHADPLFWEPSNFQSLCFHHHNAVKQSLDRGSRPRGYDVNGLPLYPRAKRK